MVLILKICNCVQKESVDAWNTDAETSLEHGAGETLCALLYDTRVSCARDSVVSLPLVFRTTSIDRLMAYLDRDIG